jgi:hypothetical protein
MEYFRRFHNISHVAPSHFSGQALNPSLLVTLSPATLSGPQGRLREGSHGAGKARSFPFVLLRVRMTIKGKRFIALYANT